MLISKKNPLVVVCIERTYKYDMSCIMFSFFRVNEPSVYRQYFSTHSRCPQQLTCRVRTSLSESGQEPSTLLQLILRPIRFRKTAHAILYLEA